MTRQLMMRFPAKTIALPALQPGIALRAFRPGEEEILKDVLLPLTGGRLSDESLNKIILGRDGIKPESVFLAFADGEPVGTATGATEADGRGQVHMVSALPAASGRGVGRALTARATSYLLAAGAKIVYLTTDDFRLAACACYLKLGFLPVADDAEMAARWRKVCEAIGVFPAGVYPSADAPEPVWADEKRRT